jgi:putative Mg2+ transporter-C (MgtC) family protein
MSADMPFILDNATKLGVALFLGALMGAEREYKGRNIGFRTIILITIGSTLFTILSLLMGQSNDPTRIASNVVTGVGFLGAGAIFRDGFTVKGVTTASLIWVSAAVGMSCGIGRFEFAVMVTGIVLIVLIGFTGMQRFIDRYNKELVYKITIPNQKEIKQQVEHSIKNFGLKFEIINHYRTDNELTLNYEIRGSQKQHDLIIEHLLEDPKILSFHV